MGSDRRSPPPPRRRHIDTAPGVSVGIPPSKPLCPTPSLPPAVFLPWPRPPHDAATEPPCTDPYARWWGRGGAVRLPPIPIAAAPRQPVRVDARHKAGHERLRED